MKILPDPPSSDLKPKTKIQSPPGLLTTGPLLSVNELAWQLRRHPSYVYAMRQAGFEMPGYRTTLAAALDWLREESELEETH